MSRIVSLVAIAAVATSLQAHAQQAELLAAPSQPAASVEDMGYAMGFQIGQQILAEQKELGSPVDAKAMAAGLADAVTGAAPKLDEAKFRAAMVSLEAAMRRKQEEMMVRMRGVAKENLEKGAAYLRAKAAEKGVVALPSGLLYEVLAEGTGPQPGPKDDVTAHYVGRHIDGRQFDATDPAGEPATFPLAQVVPGWQEALPLMKAGSKWRIHLPAALGYGEGGSPPEIGPNEVLVFEITLVGSRSAAK
jgi:FKBP-type peptidyl-prolyl cis-trans isomerase